MRRYETCTRCGETYNVPVDLNLSGKVYICPRCEREYDRVMKNIKTKGGKKKR